MATPATQERTSTNSAIATAPQEAVADSQPQHHDIPAIFRSALDTPDVSKGFWGKVGRYSEKYGENKLKSGFWNERALRLYKSRRAI